MKYVSVLAIAVAMGLSSFAIAEEIKSGLAEGKSCGAFFVTKIAGAEEDGVKTGKNLCYRCRNGGRPQVMIFTRSTDEKVAKLVKALDEAITRHKDDDLRVFVNMLADNKDDATSTAKKLATDSKAKNVPFVVPNEVENGPEDYGVNPKADVTIVMASGLKVKANHAFAAGKDVDTEAVVKDLKKLFN
jgi:hypothetical protein